MRTIGLSEAKQRFSEVLKRASEGERIGITRRGRLAAIVIPVHSDVTLDEAFAGIERLRKGARAPKSLNIKDLIEEGRA